MRQLLLFSLLVALTGLGTGCGKKPDSAAQPTNSPNAPSDTAKDDATRLKGKWSVVDYEDLSTAKMSDERKKRDEEEMKGARYVFDGEKLSIVADVAGTTFAYKLDESRNPKTLIITMVGADGKPLKKKVPSKDGKGEVEEDLVRMDWSYKFEGDTLVLAVCTTPGAAAPADFVAKLGKSGKDELLEPAVSIMKLKRNDTPPAKRTRDKTK